MLKILHRYHRIMKRLLNSQQLEVWLNIGRALCLEGVMRRGYEGTGNGPLT